MELDFYFDRNTNSYNCKWSDEEAVVDPNYASIILSKNQQIQIYIRYIWLIMRGGVDQLIEEYGQVKKQERNLYLFYVLERTSFVLHNLITTYWKCNNQLQ